jgi:DNA-binding transcriptional LysR family regulator
MEWDAYRWVLDDLVFRKGVTPNATLEASSISGILGVVQAGLGCTIFPESVAAQCSSDINHRMIVDSDAS